MMPEQKVTTTNRLTAEDIVIIVSIVISLLLAPSLTALWFLDQPIPIPPPVISIFLGIAVSALLYRFLGGVHDASFTVGALKVTGTAAILIFISWWANSELAKYYPSVNTTEPSFDLTKHVIPAYETWYPIDKETGHPISLSFPEFHQQYNAEPIDRLNLISEKRELELYLNNNRIKVKLKNSGDQIVGQVTANEIHKVGFFKSLKVSLVPYQLASFGALENKDIDTNLPFTIKTKGFSENYTRFSLIDKRTGDEVRSDAILLRGAKVIEYQKLYYLISVVQVDHKAKIDETNPEKIRAPYARIYVAEIQIDRI